MRALLQLHLGDHHTTSRSMGLVKGMAEEQQGVQPVEKEDGEFVLVKRSDLEQILLFLEKAERFLSSSTSR